MRGIDGCGAAGADHCEGRFFQITSNKCTESSSEFIDSFVDSVDRYFLVWFTLNFLEWNLTPKE